MYSAQTTSSYLQRDNLNCNICYVFFTVDVLQKIKLQFIKKYEKSVRFGYCAMLYANVYIL